MSKKLFSAPIIMNSSVPGDGSDVGHGSGMGGVTPIDYSAVPVPVRPLSGTIHSALDAI